MNQKKCVDCPSEVPFFNGEKCVPCENGQFYNNLARACESCTLGRIYSAREKKCVCPTDEFWTEYSCIRCVHPNYFDNLTKMCTSCQKNKIYDIMQQKCVDCPDESPLFDG